MKWFIVVGTLATVGMLAGLALVGESAEPSGQGEPGQYDRHAPVDPIEANGPIFVDWPPPDVALLFSGQQNGHIEPCGCAGLDNQKGGLMRRATLMHQLRRDGWPLVAMDLGGQEKCVGVQPEIKLDFSYKALHKLDYTAVGLGAHDVRMDLLPIVINLDPDKNPLVSANVGVVDFDSGLSRRYTIVEAGGMKIGITAVLGKKELTALGSLEDVVLVDPEQAIAEVLPALVEAGCDQLVLLAYAEPDEARALAQRFREFDWVVTAHGADEPPNVPAAIERAESRLIEVGHKGMYVAVVGLYREGERPWRYQRVPLDSRFPDDPEIHAMHVEYQQKLETLGLEGLGLKPTAHPSGRTYVGSATCADCHLSATDVYENTPHFHATETLVKLDPVRHFDPECLSCHATGWEPQKYFPFESGYLGLKETPEMLGNGCENCHGPASQHVAAETGLIDSTEEEMEQFRAALRLTVVENEGNKQGQVYGHVVQMCMQCHDLDNSPDFDFQTFWPQVEHPGKD